MIEEQTSERQRYYLVDLIRFSAAMMVVFYHFSASGIGNTMNDRYKLAAPKDIYPELFLFSKYGFIGVHLFFLISGFVILASALNRTAIEFAISRWTRLYPTFWCALIFTTLVLFIFLGAGFDLSPTDFLANMTLLNDYLGVTDIDPVYWTLHVELQFYGCIFLLILAGAINRYQIWLGVWMLLVIIYAFFRQPFFMPWFISPSYSSYFIAGAVFYLAARDGYRPFHIIMLLLSFCLGLFYIFPQTAEYIQDHQLKDQLITSSLITSFYLLFYLISTHRIKIKHSAAIMLLGGLTYPLYLTHHVAGRYVIDYLEPHVNRHLLLIGLLTAVLLIAYLIYAFIDKRLALFLRKILTRWLAAHKLSFAKANRL